MVSHANYGGIELSIGKGGLRFKKRASSFNVCIGKQLEGGEGPRQGGRYDKGWQSKFTAAVRSCAGRAPKTPKGK